MIGQTGLKLQYAGLTILNSNKASSRNALTNPA